MEHKGIDVSAHNGRIDWRRVRAAGIDFAMVRIGIGSRKNTPTPDKRWAENVEGALAAGLDAGAYLYSYALDEKAARQEAEFALRTIEPYRGRLTYPIAYDIEDKSQAGLGRATLTLMCAAFCGALAAAGWRPMVYANLDWLRNKLAIDSAAMDIWLAQWAVKPTYTGRTCIWQHSDKGRVDGIGGSVDMNIAYEDYPALVRRVGLNGFAPEEGAATVKPDVEPAAQRPMLRRGDRGDDVFYLQRRLIAEGYPCGPVDGAFGEKTEIAVTAYQRTNPSAADVIVGPKTWAALEM